MFSGEDAKKMYFFLSMKKIDSVVGTYIVRPRVSNLKA